MAVLNRQNGQLDSLIGKIDAPIKQHIEELREGWKGKQQIYNVFAHENTTNFGEYFTAETTLEDFEAVGENGVAFETDFRESFKLLVEPFEWKSEFRISLTLLEDAKFGKIKSKTQSFVDSYYRTKEKFGAKIISNGQLTSMTFGNKTQQTFPINTADGLAMFSTAHPSIYGDTSEGTAVQSNKFNMALTYDNMSIMETNMQNFLDDRGNLLDIEPDTIMINNNATTKQLLFEILGADGKPVTADRAGNYHMDRWDVIVWKYLTVPADLVSTSPFFYMMDSNKNQEISGLVWMTRLDLSTRSYMDDNTDAIVHKGRGRFTATPVKWRVIARAGIES